MVLIGDWEAVASCTPHFAFRLTRAAGCVTPCVPDHRPTGKILLLSDHSCRTERLGVRQAHTKGMCHRKCQEEGVREGKGLWYLTIMELVLSMTSQFLKWICSEWTSIKSKNPSVGALASMYLTHAN